MLNSLELKSTFLIIHAEIVSSITRVTAHPGIWCPPSYLCQALKGIWVSHNEAFCPLESHSIEEGWP